jgi:hypothetical protein
MRLTASRQPHPTARPARARFSTGAGKAHNVLIVQRIAGGAMTEVIIDPEVPEQVRRELEWTPLDALLGFCDQPPAPRARRLSWRRRPAADAYHRRYVVPEIDLRGDAVSLWQRTSRAARVIRCSEPVRRGLIDSVRVAVVLPCHLWEVAERLALLSGPEWRQSWALGQLDADDPEVRAVLDGQRRVRELTIADIEPRVRDLEAFADLAARADAALKRQRALRDLAGLNPDYEELLARLGGSENVLSAAGDVADELRAVARAATDAIRRANEAGHTLALPRA